MIDFSRNHFELFGLPERFRFDSAVLDRAYRELQREVHPDRFATANDAERRAALQSSARVNEAYSALKDPVARGQYLLSLHGIDALAEIDTHLPFEFLEQQLEHREEASRAFEARDVEAMERVLRGVRTDYARLEGELAALIDVDEAWDEARTVVRELKFISKLAADIDGMLSEVDVG